MYVFYMYIMFILNILSSSSLPLPVPEITPHPSKDELAPPSQGPTSGSGQRSTSQSTLISLSIHFLSAFPRKAAPTISVPFMANVYHLNTRANPFQAAIPWQICFLSSLV